MQIDIDLLTYAPIATWRPALGDIITWNGWFTSWVGVVNFISGDGAVSILKEGNLSLLCSLKKFETEKHTKVFEVKKIRGSDGKYGIIRTHPKTTFFI